MGIDPADFVKLKNDDANDISNFLEEYKETMNQIGDVEHASNLKHARSEL
jgi:hypothetical protein